jgi:hypothetical protein
MIVRGVLRIVGSAAALVALYYALPLNPSAAWAAAVSRRRQPGDAAGQPAEEVRH